MSNYYNITNEDGNFDIHLMNESPDNPDDNLWGLSHKDGLSETWLKEYPDEYSCFETDGYGHVTGGVTNTMSTLLQNSYDKAVDAFYESDLYEELCNLEEMVDNIPDGDVEPIKQFPLTLNFIGDDTVLNEFADAWDEYASTLNVYVSITGINESGEEIVTGFGEQFTDPGSFFRYGSYNIADVYLEEGLRGWPNDKVIIEVSIEGYLPGWRYLYSRQVLNAQQLYNGVTMDFQIEFYPDINLWWYGDDVPGNFMICVPPGENTHILIDQFDEGSITGWLYPIGYRVYCGPTLDDPDESIYGKREINVNFVALSQILFCRTADEFMETHVNDNGLNQYGVFCLYYEPIVAGDIINDIDDTRNYKGLSSTASMLDTIIYSNGQHIGLYGSNSPYISWWSDIVDEMINDAGDMGFILDSVSFEIGCIQKDNIYVVHQIPTVAQVKLLQISNEYSFMDAWYTFMRVWAHSYGVYSLQRIDENSLSDRLDGSFNPYGYYLTSSANPSYVPYLFNIDLSNNTPNFIYNDEYSMNAATLPCFQLDQLSIDYSNS